MVHAPIHLRCGRFSDSWEVPDNLDWLSYWERIELGRFSHRGRRRAWLAGRWVSKQLIRENHPEFVEGLRCFSIRSMDEQFRPTRPKICLKQRELPYTLSITHSDTNFLVALSTSAETKVGVDLCHLAPLPASFLTNWFTDSERERIDQISDGEEQRTKEVCRLWAAKEAIYKACNRGESFAPRQVEVSWNTGPWTCRYYDNVWKDELRLKTWEVDGHVAVTATLSIPSNALPITGVTHD
ncbi:MAG: hypothetical protein CMJ81_13355 [Planctomycetaceae bacterium]|nr:hypothetical protein [Planctomycetaceae bacterium]MBP60552.1 hypothetical protein [Planctomycetaceae bacterium]